jgi:acetylxylan esterase
MRSTFLLGFGLSICCLSSALPAISNAANSTNANTTACATGVHMIVARASTEKPGQGIIGAVATQVQEMVPGSDAEAVDYPATLQNYTTSESIGVAAMTKLIEEYTARCPSSKIALMGYSQVRVVQSRRNERQELILNREHK